MTGGPSSDPRQRPDWDDLRAFLCLLLVGTGASLVLIYAGNIVVPSAYLIFGLRPEDDLETPFRVMVPTILLILAAIGLIAFRRRFRAGRRDAIETLTAFPSGIGAVAILILIAWASGTAERAPGAWFGGGAAVALLGTLLIALQVSSEEVLLRGLLQPLLIHAWGVVVGVVVASVAFALVHFAGGWRNPVSLLNITLAGIWFGLLAWRTGGILAPTLAHFGYNWSEEMIFGASPNPGIADYGSVLDFNLSGASILGGSEDGFNASIVLTLVLVVLIAPLALRIPARTQWNSEATA